MSTKINLSALKNNTKTEQDINNIKEIEQKSSPPKLNNNIEKKDEEKKSTRVITVSLWKKKDNSENKLNINIWKKIDENKNSNSENEKTILKDNLEKDKENSSENKININIWKKIDENKNSNSENKKTILKDNLEKDKENNSENKDSNLENNSSDNNPETNETETIFSNYKSDFVTEEKTLFQKIKELKNLPKTRPQLIIWMIAFLIIWTSILVYIAPADSTLKADILNWNKTKITQQIPKKIEPPQKIKKKKITKTEINNKLKDFLLKKKKIKKKNIDNLKNFFQNKKQNNTKKLKDFFKKNKVK